MCRVTTKLIEDEYRKKVLSDIADIKPERDAQGDGIGPQREAANGLRLHTQPSLLAAHQRVHQLADKHCAARVKGGHTAVHVEAAFRPGSEGEVARLHGLGKEDGTEFVAVGHGLWRGALYGGKARSLRQGWARINCRCMKCGVGF